MTFKEIIEETMKVLNRQDVLDMLKGCVILGTGGGGSLDEGLELIEEVEKLNKTIKLADINDIPDDAMIVTPYFLGAVSELPEEERKKYEGLPAATENPFMTAANELESFYKRPVYGTIACETGGSNTAVPMYVAALKSGVILDADLAGRAVPEVQNSTYYIHNLPASPIFVSNEFGEVAIYKNIKDDLRAERILRSFASESKNTIAAIDHALPMKMLRHAIIPGTLSKALDLGLAHRKAIERKDNVAIALAEAAGGIVVFSGTIEQFDWKTEAGFTIGSFQAKGFDPCSGDRLKVWFKNENLMSWLNGELFVTLPDLICVIDIESGEPVSNPNYEEKMEIAVIVYPAPEAFTTPRGLEAFGPRTFGFDVEYIPAIGRVKAIH